MAVSDEARARAMAATMRRLVAALVTEALVACKRLNADGDSEQWVAIERAEDADDGAPAFLAKFRVLPEAVVGTADRVQFLDAEDVVSNVVVQFIEPAQVGAVDHPAALFELIAPWLSNAPDGEVTAGIAAELRSSVRNQELAFGTSYPAPTLESPAIEWEQSILEGHPVHPMHRTRIGLTEEQVLAWASEFRHPVDILFVSMPREDIAIHGDFEAMLTGWAPAAPAGRAVLPVHPGQWRTLRELFPQAELVAGASQPALAQTSLRSLAPLSLPFHVKLALAVQATSAVRTVSPYSVFNGPLITAVARAIAPPPLLVIGEVATAGSTHPKPSVAKHLACILRDDPERLRPGERLVVAAALVERDPHTHVPHVISALGLETSAARTAFFERYAQLFLECFVPPLRDHAFAFEAHSQNVLARFSPAGELLGFAVRDFGGVRVHPPTLQRTLGIDLELLPGSTILGEQPEASDPIVFHTGIQMHLHRMGRALGLHHSGVAWHIVHRHLARLLGDDAPLLRRWLEPTVDYKCLLTMRIKDAICDYVFRRVPNVLAAGLARYEQRGGSKASHEHSDAPHTMSYS